MIAFDLYPRKCAVCGKRFEGSLGWAYKRSKGKKRGFVYFCSYKCLRADQKKNIEKYSSACGIL